METKSLISLTFLLLVILNGVNLIITQKPGPHQQAFKCSNKGNLESDIHLAYRDSAFNMLYQNLGRPNMYKGYDIGYKADDNFEIWTTALCPPNIKMEACQQCVNNTIPYLKKNCPNQKEGVAWTALPNLNCMVRYEDQITQMKLIDWAWTNFSSPPNETPGNANELEKGVSDLAIKLKNEAAEGGFVKKFEAGSIAYGSGSRTLFGSMQCTPDIGETECKKCLSVAIDAIHNCCSKERKLSAITMSTNCYFWYAHHNFLPKTSPVHVII